MPESTSRRRPLPVSAPSVTPAQALQDILLCSQAQAVLCGLTGCTSEVAARTMLSIAAQFDLPVERVAGTILGFVNSGAAGPAEALVRACTAAALAADPGGAPPSDREPALQAVPLTYGGAQGVRATGELDLATGPLLRAAVAAAYRSASPLDRLISGGRFLLDLTGVSFLDTAGVQVLRRIHARVNCRGDQLHVAGPSARSPQRLLALAVGNGWLRSEFARGRPAVNRRPQAPPPRGPARSYLPAGTCRSYLA